MKFSDEITQMILKLLNSEGGIAEIQRNEFANKIGCAPSQINYVITSRFTPEKGYIVESRRGGGGYIRITRVNMNKKELIMHIINSVGNRIDLNSARVIIENLAFENVFDERIARIIFSAVNENALRDIPQELRDTVRATIFKQVLLNLF